MFPVRFMCTTHKASVQRQNVHKANAPAILARHQPFLTSLIIYYSSTSKFTKISAGRDVQNCCLFNTLAVRLKQIKIT